MESLNADAATRSALDSIRRIVQALRLSSRATESRVGLSSAQLFVLQRLATSPAMSVNELAERTLTHQSSVSVVVSRLVENGLVSRTTSPADARRVQLTLTARGRRILKRAPDAVQDRLIAGLRELPIARRRALATELGRLVRAMGLVQKPAAMFFEESPARAKRSSR